MTAQEAQAFIVQGIEGLVEALPAIIGYTPRESAVIIPLTQDASRGVMRLDFLPDSTPAEFAAKCTGFLCRVKNADAVLVFIFTDQPTPVAHMEALTTSLTAAGIEVREAVHVTSTQWMKHGDPDTWHPLQEAAIAPGADQYPGSALPTPDPATLAAVAALEDPLNGMTGMTDLAGAEMLDAIEAALDGAETAEQIAFMGAILSRPSLRDTAIARMFWGDGPAPVIRRVRAALALTTRVAVHMPAPASAGAFAAAAWLSWALGLSTVANAYAAHALEADPEHGLAEIVLAMVRAEHLPSWAYRGR